MSLQALARLAAAVLIVAASPSCHRSGSSGLTGLEVDFLSEDVIDLMTIVFQAAEEAFVLDRPDPSFVVDPAGTGNDFRVTYDLPAESRPRLGFGDGTAALRVLEDGIVNEDPFTFSFGGTDALEVLVEFDLSYDGEARSGRLTEIDFIVDAVATRPTASDPFTVEYFVEGEAFLGATFTEISTTFAASGRPRDGVEAGFGDGDGIVDDPDVFDVFELDLDFDDTDSFVAKGDVGSARFKERFRYSEVF